MERLNQIIELANLHNKVLGLSLIPKQQPTYERMLLTPSVLQKGASGLCTETTDETINETAGFPLDEEFSDAGDSDDGFEDAVSAIKPFLFPAVRMCPFVAKGLCKHAGYTKQRALSTHCRMKHKDENGQPIILTTVEEDPLEDGTAKIPCRWKCDRFFASYHAANDHSKKANTHCEKSEANIYPRPCPWSEVPGTECTVSPFASSQAESHHCTKMHNSDARRPYQCHLCDAYYADLYALSSHVDDCEKQDHSGRTTSNQSTVKDSIRKKENKKASN